MAISRIDGFQAAGTSQTISAAENDLVLVFAYRNNSATAPSLPANFTDITTISNSGGGTNGSMRAGWRVAPSGGLTTTGVWTNATHITGAIIRGINTSDPIGAFSTSGGNNSGTLITFAAVTLETLTDSWIFAGAGRTTADAQMTVAPSGLTNRGAINNFLAVNDSNGIRSSNWPSTNVTGFGGSAKFTTIVVEIRAAVAASPTRGRVSFAEFETPSLAARGRLSFTEFETPLVKTRGKLSFAEFETPNVQTRGRLSFGEFEVPGLLTRGRLSWGEFEVPEFVITPTRGRVSFAEVEVPNVKTRGRVSFSEVEVPFVKTRGRLSFTEFESPNVPTRGRISFTEFEAPNVKTRGRLSFTELEVPNVSLITTRGRLSHLVFEIPNLVARGRISHVEFEVPNLANIPGEICGLPANNPSMDDIIFAGADNALCTLNRIGTDTLVCSLGDGSIGVNAILANDGQPIVANDGQEIWAV